MSFENSYSKFTKMRHSLTSYSMPSTPPITRSASFLESTSFSTIDLSRAFVAVSELGEQVKQEGGKIIKNAISVANNAVLAAQMRVQTHQTLSRQQSDSNSDKKTSSDYDTVTSISKDSWNKAQIWGDHNFHFDLNILCDEGSTPGSICVETSSIEIIDKEKKIGENIQCQISWKRKYHGDYIVDIPNANGKTYSVTVDDIGCSIVAEVKAPQTYSQRYSGTAYGLIGPFEVDSKSRHLIEQGFSNGCIRFPCEIIEPNTQNNFSLTTNYESRTEKNGTIDNGIIRPSTHAPHYTYTDCIIHIMAEDVKILQPGPSGQGYSRQWGAKYSVEYPQAHLNQNDFRRFLIVMGADKEQKMQIQAVSRHQRDLIVLSLRCFHARSFISTSALLDVVLATPGYKNGDLSSVHGKINLMTMLDRLSIDLSRSLDLLQKCDDERCRALAEKEALEEEITCTINAFQLQLGDIQSGRASSNRQNFSSVNLSHSYDTKRSCDALALSNSIDSSVKPLKEKIDTLQATISEKEENNDVLQKQLNTLEQKYMQLKTSYHEKNQKKNNTMESENQYAHVINKLEHRISSLEGDLKTKIKQLDQKEKDYNTIQEKLITTESYFQKERDEVYRIQENCKKLEYKYQDEVCKNEKANEINNQLNEKLREESKKNEELSNETNRWCKKVESLSKDLDRCKNQIKDKKDLEYDVKPSNLNGTIGTFEDGTLAQNAEITKLLNEIKNQNSRISELERNNEIYRSRIQKLAKDKEFH